jgi:hypothetical protein
MPVITEKPNQVTPSDPFKAKNKTSNAPGTDDVVDRAFRLEAMRRQIQSANLQPRQKYPFAQTSN